MWELYLEGRGFCGFVHGTQRHAKMVAKRVANGRAWLLTNGKKELKGKW